MADPTRSTKSGAKDRAGGRGSWRTWVLGIAILLLAIIAIQNSDRVEIRFLFVDSDTPLIFGLLIAGALGAIIGYLAPIIRTHRKEQHRREER